MNQVDTSDRKRQLWILARQHAATIGVFVSLLALTAAVTTALHWVHREQARQAFERQSLEALHLIKQQFAVYEQLLRSGAAFVTSSERVSRAQWKRFADYALKDDRYPGVLALGYAPLARQSLRQRIDSRYQTEIDADFKNWPQGKRPTYVPITHVAPLSDESIETLGFDMYSEPSRRSALDRALRSNAIAMTAPIRLEGDKSKTGKTGVVVYYPVLQTNSGDDESANARSVAGFVFSVFRIQELFDSTLQRLGDEIALEITDTANADGLVYQSASQHEPAAIEHDRNYQWTSTQTILQRDLDLTFHSLPAFESRMRSKLATAAAGVGIVITAIVTLLTSMIVSQKFRNRWAGPWAGNDMAEREKLLRRFAQHAPVGIYLTDPHGKCVYVNDRWCQLAGLSQAAAIGKEWTTALHPDDRDRVKQQWKQALAAGTELRSEHRYVRPDGEVVWTTSGVSALVSSDGRVTNYLGMVADITERLRTERELANSRQFLSDIIDAIPIPLAVKDEQCRFVIVNRANAQFHEHDVIDFLGKTDADIFPSGRAIAYRREDEKVLMSGAPFVEEQPFIDSSGEARWVIKYKHRIRLTGGRTGIVTTLLDISQRRNVELALRASEQRFRSLTAMSADWYWEQDKELRFTFFSKTEDRYMPLDPATLLGKTPFEIALDFESRAARAQHAETLAKREAFRDVLMVDASRNRWVMISGEPIYTESTDFEGYRGVGRDVSPAKKAEQTLRETGERYKLLAEFSSDMISRLDDEGVFTYASPASATLYGRAAEQLIGQRMTDLVHPDDAAEMRELFSSVVAGRVIANTVTCRIAHPQRDWVWAETSFRRTGLAGGANGLSVIAVSRDVSERVKSTQMLNEFKNVLDNTVDIVLMFDPETFHFFYVNNSAVKNFGFTRDQFMLLTLLQISPEMTESSYREFIAPLLNGGRHSLHYETSLKRSDGSTFPAEVSLQLIERQGEQRAFVSVVRDITERLKVDRMKNEFVSTVSHELRTPVTSIRGSLGLLSAGVVGKLPSKARQLVKIAEQNSERLIRLINDILDMEKMESGEMRFSFRNVALPGLLDSALAINQGYGEQFGVAFRLKQPIPDVEVRIDPDRIAQVLSNLLSNAAKFSSPGGIVYVEAIRDKSRMRIEVSDRGTGVPEEFHDKIFEKFSQADGSDRRRIGGTGLGLSIAKMIVEKHAGTIGFNTTVGEGTTFFFDLPVARHHMSDRQPVREA